MSTPNNSPDNGLLLDPAKVTFLADGYTAARINGRIVAMTVGRDRDDTDLVPAIVDGQAEAVPVFDVTAFVDAAEERIAAHRRAVDTMAPAPVPAAAPAADQGLPLAVRQYIVFGSLAALAAGGAMWMLGAAIAEVAPHADKIGELLKWTAVLVGAVVLGVATLLGKLRSLTTTAAPGTAPAATASGEGASATGTVLAFVHRTHTTTIGRQSAGWRGSINNHNG
ncbi:hypothetical protein [Kitasatospora sp. NBC_01300]|uniref:hypothetical protein n=1 Tax=Kitasatospora sp. NBC_01300 TaxID=2903574 RepID=UPI002F914562|nr:hypothetical protein OG556_40255 [Kitasatospora sp. NBC_01300]